MTTPHPLAYHTGGSVIMDDIHLTLIQAERARMAAVSLYGAARRAGEIEAMHWHARQEQALRAAMWGAAQWRRAAGWSDPLAADAIIQPRGAQ